MPRRLIIAILVILIVGILGGTAVLVMQRLRQGAKPAASPQPSGSLNEAAGGGQQIANPTADDDGDGLSNADENTWGTDPKNPDTDGDGYKDGEEVKAGHNPTIPAPNDKLPDGFVPGKSIDPLAEAPASAVPVDQFFADNLDLSGGNQNLTAAYQSKYPEVERTPDTLEAFVKAQPIITQLPAPIIQKIQTQPADTPLVLNEYIETAADLSVFSNRSAIADAVNALFSNNDPSQIKGLATSVRAHQQTLLGLRVPPSALNLQKLLLGYTQLLAASYDQMALYPDDEVKGVVGMRQLEENDKKYIPLIEQEIQRVKSLQSADAGQ
jgi:hypothetical protein